MAKQLARLVAREGGRPLAGPTVEPDLGRTGENLGRVAEGGIAGGLDAAYANPPCDLRSPPRQP